MQRVCGASLIRDIATRLFIKVPVLQHITVARKRALIVRATPGTRIPTS